MLMMLAAALSETCAALATPWGLTCECREDFVGTGPHSRSVRPGGQQLNKRMSVGEGLLLRKDTGGGRETWRGRFGRLNDKVDLAARLLVYFPTFERSL